MGDQPPVTVIGLWGDRLDQLSGEARTALADADVVVGDRRQLQLWQAWRHGPTLEDGPAFDDGPVRGAHVRREAMPTASGASPGAGTHVPDAGAQEPDALEIGDDVGEISGAVRRAVDGSARVCVLASGDPGFFGILRSLLHAVDRKALRVLPGPSAVSLAFARLGLPWDDAVVVSAHGRPTAEAVRVARTAHKVAVLTSPEAPPEALGAALLEAGVTADLTAVCSRLGTAGEAVVELSLADLAAGHFDPLSVVVLVAPEGLPLVGWASGTGKVLAWGMPESAAADRAGMITKSEIRSVVLGKLALPDAGVLWDVGAGSGSVAVECALLRPGLTVLDVEDAADAAARVASNALALGAAVHVVGGQAPDALRDLPAPDRVFVGDAGIEVLDAALGRLRPGGTVVAAFSAMDRAALAAERLGNLVQVSVDRGVRLPDGGWRLDARNPVFVAWGPGQPGGPTG